MGKHTPGPWVTSDTNDIFTSLGAKNGEGFTEADDRAWHIADCAVGWLSGNEVKANARLISAAPDLLKALEDALQYIENRYWGYCPEGRDVIDVARVSIAKARGEE